MIIKRKNLRPYNHVLFILLSFIASFNAFAQEGYDSIMNKYKNENAVITNITERLVIKNEDGKLVARSNISREKLLISEMSPGLYNSETIYHSYFNKLENFDAFALIPSDKGYKKKKDYLDKTSPSEDDNIFYDDGKQTEISFSGLTKKAVVKTSYTISHTDLHMLPVFHFQESIPSVKLVFEIIAPKYVHFKFVIKGEHSDWIKQTREESKNTITYTFTAENVPALKQYNDLPSVSYYMPHVIAFITSYQLPHDDQPTKLLGSPDDLYAYYYNFIKDVNTHEDEHLSSVALEVTKGDKTDREKAAHIYQWVQKNIHYIAFEDSLGGFVPRQAADICKRKFGDCKDMASILTAMCRKVGLKAYFTWIGTRHKPYTYEETPLPLVDNHMICALKLGDEWLFMDGTDPVIPFGLNPSGIQNKEALIAIDEKTFKIMKVPETSSEINQVFDSTYLHLDGKHVSGSVTINYKGYPAWTLENTLVYYKNDDREKYIRSFTSRGSNKYVQKSYTFNQSEEGYKDARITSEFTVDNYVQNVGKEFYINMNVNRTFENDWVDTDGRNVPVSFKYKCKMREVVVLDIPHGFTATYVPPDDARSLGSWGYSISYKVLPGKIILTKDYELRSLSLAVDQFSENNKIVDHLKKQYKESVVLTAN